MTLLADEAHTVLGTLCRQLSADVEEVGLHLVVLFRQHAGYGQRIAAVVARSSHYHHRHVVVPSFHDGACQLLCSPFHQVDGFHGFMFYRVFVQLTYLATVEYLHIKVQR